MTSTVSKAPGGGRADAGRSSGASTTGSTMGPERPRPTFDMFSRDGFERPGGRKAPVKAAAPTGSPGTSERFREGVTQASSSQAIPPPKNPTETEILDFFAKIPEDFDPGPRGDIFTPGKDYLFFISPAKALPLVTAFVTARLRQLSVTHPDDSPMGKALQGKLIGVDAANTLVNELRRLTTGIFGFDENTFGGGVRMGLMAAQAEGLFSSPNVLTQLQQLKLSTLAGAQIKPATANAQSSAASLAPYPSDAQLGPADPTVLAFNARNTVAEVSVPKLEAAFANVQPIQAAELQSFLEGAYVYQATWNQVHLVNQSQSGAALSITCSSGAPVQLVYRSGVPARQFNMALSDSQLPAFLALVAGVNQGNGQHQAAHLQFLETLDALAQRSEGPRLEASPQAAIDAMVSAYSSHKILPDFNRLRGVSVENSSNPKELHLTSSLGGTGEHNGGILLYPDKPPVFQVHTSVLSLDRPELINDAVRVVNRISALMSAAGVNNPAAQQTTAMIDAFCAELAQKAKNASS